MSSTPQLLGDVPLEDLLPKGPVTNDFYDVVIRDETLRKKYEDAQAIDMILCGGAHAFGPDGALSEQQCAFRKKSGVCLHPEQVDSGFGVIRQFVQASLLLGIATPEQLQTILKADYDLGQRDRHTHDDAPLVRKGLLSLPLAQGKASREQEAAWPHIRAVRDAVAERALAFLDLPYEQWKERNTVSGL